jgi:hypothetical protein
MGTDGLEAQKTPEDQSLNRDSLDETFKDFADQPEAQKALAELKAELTVFDYRKAAAELASSESERHGRKLTLFDQCQAFAALRNRARTPVVAAAFGITKAAAAQIAGCLKGERYRAVKREFLYLGEDSFYHKYYTKDLFDRLLKVKYNIDGEATRFDRKAPNRKADSKSVDAIGVFEVRPNEFWQVNFVGPRLNPELAGWRFAYCQADGQPLEGEDRLRWKGAEALDGGEPRPFRTSGYAYNAAWRYCNMDPPK